MTHPLLARLAGGDSHPRWRDGRHIDSSSTAIIREGLSAADRRAGRPLLNSAALERLDVLDLARDFDASVVVTATGRGSIPGTSARVWPTSRS